MRQRMPSNRLDHVATLGDEDDPVLLNWYSTLAAGAGLIAAGRVPEHGTVPLFEMNGEERGKLGPPAAGPVNFSRPGPERGFVFMDLLRPRVIAPDD